MTPISDRLAYTAAQVREAEQPLLDAGEPLMARAAAALAGVVREVLGRLADASAGARVLVLAGRGNNGGDALFAAADLLGPGAAQPRTTVDVLLTADGGHTEGLAAAVAAGARVATLEVVREEASAYAVVIDGILGIGTSADPALRGVARDAVAALLPAVRRGDLRVIAVDLPSGLHPDDGTTADDLVLPADVTVTFGALKAGLIRGRGPELCGELTLVDIGLARGLAAAEPAAEASTPVRVLAA